MSCCERPGLGGNCRAQRPSNLGSRRAERVTLLVSHIPACLVKISCEVAMFLFCFGAQALRYFINAMAILGKEEIH